MRAAKLGALAALLAFAVIGVLWVTEAVPRQDLKDAMPKTLGAIAILVVVGIVVSLLRGQPGTPDETDKRVP